MSLTKKTINLLRKVEKQILDEPRRLDMNQWGITNEPNEQFPACKTQGCIAGWTCMLSDKGLWKSLVQKSRSGDYTERRLDMFLPGFVPSEKAAKLLNLTEKQADNLFYFKLWKSGVSGWPEKYSNAYDKAKTPAGRARATVNRIEHFIKTDGAE